MHRVESERIIELEGPLGFEYRAYICNKLYIPQWNLTDARAFYESDISCHISALSLTWSERLFIDCIYTKPLLELVRAYYRGVGNYNTRKNCYEIDLSTSLLSLGVNMRDLIYGASLSTKSGETRALIAALNDGLVSRIILPEHWASDLITRFLSQSHANPRALARGLYDGWIPFFDSLQAFQPRLQKFVIELPPWTGAQSE